MADKVDIEIGFEGGTGVSVSTDDAQWEQLQSALRDGGQGFVQLTGKDDATYLIATNKITYTRVAGKVRSLGFRN